MNQLARPQPQLIQSLREQVRLCTLAARGAEGELISSGSPALNRLLPGGGFHRGTLVEWLSQSRLSLRERTSFRRAKGDNPTGQIQARSASECVSADSTHSLALRACMALTGHGSGAATLALLGVREACREGGTLVVLDRQRRFYPPAAVGRGIGCEQMIVIHAGSQREENWATDQALRSPGVAAVLCWPDKLDERTFRRWQLAAESSGVLGLLMRPETVRSSPSWAELRLLVSPVCSAELQFRGHNDVARPAHGTEVPYYEPRDRRLRVELLRCRGGAAGGMVEMEMDAGG